MLSAIFVDRPRLAIVIAIVTTIAGALAFLAMPVAQYPDIVPPQVSVTTFYPGANSAVIDATVAQPIEAQAVGVDKMMYMKSTSGDDGSYTLTASFELGTDPDINTVNVNNRVQAALSSLPSEVQRQGVVVKKKSTAILATVALYSPKQTHDPLFLSNYLTINMLDSIKSTPGVGDASLFAAQDYAMRAWVRTDRLTGLNRRHHQRDPVAEHPGRGRAHRRPADLRRSATAAQHPGQGPADLRCGIREHRHSHQSGRIGAAAARRRQRGARRRQRRP
jgi:multidrug efflux pump subunit AcrB